MRLGIRLGPVRDTDPAIERLVLAMQRLKWRISRRRLGRIFEVTLPASIDAFKAQHHHTIKKATYYERRLRKSGVVNITRHNALDCARWARVYDQLAEIERNSWVARKGGNFKFEGPRNRCFWQSVLGDKYISSCTVAWILSIDGKPISFLFALVSGDCEYILANCYHEGMKAHSPGHILACHALTDAVRRRISKVNWGQGDSGYKQRWGAHSRMSLLDYLILPPGLIGRCVALVGKVQGGYSLVTSKNEEL